MTARGVGARRHDLLIVAGLLAAGVGCIILGHQLAQEAPR